jgi:catechol 2,3-dioxygenase-like lactoylglutathione lyase family enzyme
MRLKGVHHVEFSVLDYENSIKFFDKMFGWLGYSSFWTLDIEYRSTYYMARFPFFHSYIGIQPAKSGKKLHHTDRTTGIHHIALWAVSKKEVNDFYNDFLLKNHIEVTDIPAEHPIYYPGYYAVVFNDPITGIHFELSHTPLLPSIRVFIRWIRLLNKIRKGHPEWESPPWKKSIRKLPSRICQ